MIVTILIIAVFVAFVILFLGETTNTKKTSTLSSDVNKSRVVEIPPQSQKCEGSWSEWVESSPCTATCANPEGTKEMTQTFTIPPGASDQWCSDDSQGDTRTKTEACGLDPASCPCEGSWSEWVESSPCTATCSSPQGTKEMTQTYTVPSTSSDIWCPGFSEGDTQSDTVECRVDPASCPCEGSWSEWVESSPCTATCANPEGTKEMTQTFTVPSTSSDIWCPGLTNGGTESQTEECSMDPASCPCEGSWSEWVESSPCTATCDSPDGTKGMTQTYTVPPHFK